jgi:hypothetical protein
LKTKYLLFVFSLIEVLFLGIVSLNWSGHQDLWILQGIFLPTLIYISAFVIIALKIDNNKILVFLSAAFLITLNAIPDIKYQFFLGTFDSAAHYGFANQILTTGFVSTTGFYSSQYADFPGMHILLSAVSLVLGISLVESVKILTSIIYGVIPFLFYFVSNGILDKKLQKYLIISSGLPVTYMSYILGGVEFATPFFLAFLCIFLKNNLHRFNKTYSIVLLIVFVGILFSHAVTSISLILLTGLMLILLFPLKFLRRTYSYFGYIFSTLGILALISIILIAWFDLKATSIFDLFKSIAQSYFSPTVENTVVPSTFFKVPLLDQLRILILYHARDAMVFVFSLVGLFALFREFLPRNRYLFKNLFIPLLCLMLATLLLLGFDFITGRSEYLRFLVYILSLSPFLIGLSLWSIDRFSEKIAKSNWKRLIFLFAVIFSIIAISLVQIYPYQPLMPSANVISKTYPTSEYLFDVSDVNTIYQVSMINFADKYSPTDLRITSDLSTSWQIAGFASENFSNHQIGFGYSPFLTNLTAIGLNWDICLTHYDGKAGPLNEYIGNRTRSAIDEFRVNSGDAVYDNGESFIINREFG